jgi:hypothetical protein
MQTVVGLVSFTVATALVIPHVQSSSPKPGAQSPTELSTKYLKVRLGPIDPTATPGGRAMLTLDVTPGPKIHVYAPGQNDYIPISLALDASKDFKTSPAKYPESLPLFLAPINMTAKVYNKPFQIAQTITLATTPALRQRAGAKETLIVNGTLKYQACDDLVCYRPDSLPVSWKIALAAGR